MSSGGSCPELAAKVAAALLEQGCTNLEAKIASYIASFGDTNWQTDRTLADKIAKDRWGAHYHRSSIARARRLLARAGYIHSKRVLAGQVPEGAKYQSAHGTTSKGIRWKNVGVARPPKSERRKAAERARALERHERLAKPRYAAAGAITAPNPHTAGRASCPTPDPELAQVIAQTTAAMTSLWARRGVGEEQKPTPRQGPDPPE